MSDRITYAFTIGGTQGGPIYFTFFTIDAGTYDTNTVAGFVGFGAGGPALGSSDTYGPLFGGYVWDESGLVRDYGMFGLYPGGHGAFDALRFSAKIVNNGDVFWIMAEDGDLPVQSWFVYDAISQTTSHSYFTMGTDTSVWVSADDVHFGDFDIDTVNDRMWVTFVGKLAATPTVTSGGLVRVDLSGSGIQPPWVGRDGQAFLKIVLLSDTVAYVALQVLDGGLEAVTIVDLSGPSPSVSTGFAAHTPHTSQSGQVCLAYSPINEGGGDTGGDPMVAYGYADESSCYVAFINANSGVVTTYDLGSPWGNNSEGYPIAPANICFTEIGDYAFALNNDGDITAPNGRGVTIDLFDITLITSFETQAFQPTMGLAPVTTTYIPSSDTGSPIVMIT